MKVSLFFDGKNFYYPLREYRKLDSTLEIDYSKFVNVLVKQAGGTDFSGAYYFTGFEEGTPRRNPFSKFLWNLELQRGYFVIKGPRRWYSRRKKQNCPNCGGVFWQGFSKEKQVDTKLSATMVHHATVGSFDIAILLSGDEDFIPAVEVVHRLGKRVFVATWGD